MDLGWSKIRDIGALGRGHGGRFAAEVRDPWKKTRVWLGTFDSTKEVASAYDADVGTLQKTKAKIYFPVVLGAMSTFDWNTHEALCFFPKIAIVITTRRPW